MLANAPPIHRTPRSPSLGAIRLHAPGRRDRISGRRTFPALGPGCQTRLVDWAIGPLCPGRAPGSVQEAPVTEDGAPGDVTRLLRSVGDDGAARDRLLPLVYDELHRIAQGRMAGERAGHTLQATALVNEAYVRLVGVEEIDWNDRSHFFGIAAEAMRRVLIDHARKRASQKRGGGRGRLDLTVADLAADTEPETMIAVDEALTKLEAEDPQAATVVKLRFFAGLTAGEAARAMDVSERTVMREWAFARARLFELLGGERDGAEGGDDAGSP